MTSYKKSATQGVLIKDEYTNNASSTTQNAIDIRIKNNK